VIGVEAAELAELEPLEEDGNTAGVIATDAGDAEGTVDGDVLTSTSEATAGAPEATAATGD